MDGEKLDTVFKALADSNRRKIIDLLRAESGQSLFQICSHLTIASQAEGGKGISRQAVSQHLEMLEKAGMLRVTWSGRIKLHALDLGPVRGVVDTWLGTYLRLAAREQGTPPPANSSMPNPGDDHADNPAKGSHE